MKAIILAAGYSTRLYPLTKDTPKPLLPIGKIPIIERILEKVQAVNGIDQIYIVTNSRFITHFEKWLEKYKRESGNFSAEIILVDDGTDTNETRLGPVRDIALVLQKYDVRDDVFVTAGDNLFEMDLENFCSVSRLNQASVLAVYEFESIDHVRNKFGVVVADENNRVVGFEEKPGEPKSSLAATAVYLFKKEDIKYIINLSNQATEKEINVGEIIKYFVEKNLPVYCEFLTTWFDIGSHDDLKKADEYYKD